MSLREPYRAIPAAQRAEFLPVVDLRDELYSGHTYVSPTLQKPPCNTDGCARSVESLTELTKQSARPVRPRIVGSSAACLTIAGISKYRGFGCPDVVTNTPLEPPG